MAGAIAAAGGSAEALRIDVTEPASVSAGLKALVEKHGKLDILVNNAGITDDGLILRMSKDAWDKVVATDLTGVFLVRPGGGEGHAPKKRVPAASSTSRPSSASWGTPGQTNYAAAKAGVVGFTKALAREIGSRGITVNAVAPGLHRDGDDGRAERGPEEGARRPDRPRAARHAASDVADAVLYLASDLAVYVTGNMPQRERGPLHRIDSARLAFRVPVALECRSFRRRPRFRTEDLMSNSVEDKVKSIIVEQLGVQADEVKPEASFVDDLGADSLDTVELVMAFEEAFGIEIPDEDAEKIQKVKDAVAYIEGKAKPA